MKWTDNLLLEGEDEHLAERGQWQLAMYALHLSMGHTIYCKQIRLSTIEEYVRSAATFLALFIGRDVRKDSPTDKGMGHILAPVYREIRRFEGVPDRREPYELEMHKAARKIAAEHPRDTLIPSLTDGFERGVCAGDRLTEWAQRAGNYDVSKPQLNHLVSQRIRVRAIVPDDYEFMTNDNRRLLGLDVLSRPLEDIDKCWVEYRTQKNGAHGEKKLHVRNKSPDGICYVASVYRSMERFRRLQLLDGRIASSKTPLAIYYDPQASMVKLITATEIEMFMRHLAAQVYHLHPVKDAKELQRWSAHSLRVGACVLLHAMGFSDRDIQWILRWRSMAFVSYLRNIAILAIRQHRALDKAAAMPHLI